MFFLPQETGRTDEFHRIELQGLNLHAARKPTPRQKTSLSALRDFLHVTAITFAHHEISQGPRPPPPSQTNQSILQKKRVKSLPIRCYWPTKKGQQPVWKTPHPPNSTRKHSLRRQRTKASPPWFHGHEGKRTSYKNTCPHPKKNKRKK